MQDLGFRAEVQGKGFWAIGVMGFGDVYEARQQNIANC